MTIASSSDVHGMTSARAPFAKLAFDRLRLGLLVAVALVGLLLSYFCGVDPSSIAP
jgi:uncharacterized membrane protein